MALPSFVSYLNYVLDFVISNPALYAAVFIPICINSTIRASIGINMESLTEQKKILVTWVEIAAQIGSVIALSMANLVALILLMLANRYSVELKAVTIFIALYYLFFYVGFRINKTQFEEYKQRLGFRLPPIRNKVTITRIVGSVIEVAIPTYVYFVVVVWNDPRFTIPGNLPTLLIGN